MIQVYVTKMPKEEKECPYFGKSNNKCNITNDKCCLTSKPECEHLATLEFNFEEESK